MRGLLTVILFIIFFFSFSIAIYTYSINLVFQADYVKNRLSESKIYSAVASELPGFIERSREGEDGLVPPEIKKEITAEYLQDKVESFVGDTFEWLSGKTSTVPGLSFADLAVKLKKQPAAHFLSADITKVLNTPLKLPLEERENWRSSFQLSQVAPGVLSVVSAIVLLVIFLMARDWKSKLRKTSLALFIPAVLGLITAGLLVFIGSVIVGMITGALVGSEFAQFEKPLGDLLTQIPVDVSVRMGVIYGAALAVSAGLFVASFFVSRSVQPGQKEEPLPATLPAAQK